MMTGALSPVPVPSICPQDSYCGRCRHGAVRHPCFLPGQQPSGVTPVARGYRRCSRDSDGAGFIGSPRILRCGRRCGRCWAVYKDHYTAVWSWIHPRYKSCNPSLPYSAQCQLVAGLEAVSFQHEIVRCIIQEVACRSFSLHITVQHIEFQFFHGAFPKGNPAVLICGQGACLPPGVVSIASILNL